MKDPAESISRSLEQCRNLKDVMSMKSRIVIAENGEPLIPLPEDEFLFFNPHVYAAAGAPYGESSPFCLRSGVVGRLRNAQELLASHDPKLRFKIFDGYRPVAVQEYMVEHTFRAIAARRGFSDVALIPGDERESIYREVFNIWARPNRDPKAPPPHATGGAVDLTICDSNGAGIDMGSPIDAMPPLCNPHHFADGTDKLSRQRHANRELLNSVMHSAGFVRLTHEWWHFSYGDQFWAMIKSLDEPDAPVNAVYGHWMFNF